MASVGQELASRRGILEPLQTADSLDGQVEELKTVLEKHADIPVIQVVFSWGAWLSFITAARYPALVKKLILIGCGGFEQKYAAQILETRLERLSEEERTEAYSLIEILDNPSKEDANTALERIGAIFSKTDAYNPAAFESKAIDCQVDVYQGVWNEAVKLRKSGELLNFGRHITCPVVAVNGGYDPHPAEGVRKPLSAVLKDFRFILLKSCGHRPWIEKEAGKTFYAILIEELR